MFKTFSLIPTWLTFIFHWTPFFIEGLIIKSKWLSQKILKNDYHLPVHSTHMHMPHTSYTFARHVHSTSGFLFSFHNEFQTLYELLHHFILRPNMVFQIIRPNILFVIRTLFALCSLFLLLSPASCTAPPILPLKPETWLPCLWGMFSRY